MKYNHISSDIIKTTTYFFVPQKYKMHFSKYLILLCTILNKINKQYTSKQPKTKEQKQKSVNKENLPSENKE